MGQISVRFEEGWNDHELGKCIATHDATLEAWSRHGSVSYDFAQRPRELWKGRHHRLENRDQSKKESARRRKCDRSLCRYMDLDLEPKTRVGEKAYSDRS